MNLTRSFPRRFLAYDLRKLFTRLTSTNYRIYMRFVIRPTSGHFPKLERGSRGSELACYIPEGLQWRQLNYGQSEGQVEIDGREWGFYWEGPNEMVVVLHSGEMEADAATNFVRRVAEKVCATEEGFRIYLKGDTSIER